jgi:Acetyltransferase (GNAT) family
VIGKLTSTELRFAAQLLALGMRDNPLHIQAFGPQAEHRRRGLARFFEPVLHRAFNRGSVFGLVNDDVLVGVYVETPPGSCKLGVVEKLKIFPSIYFCNSLTTSVRVLNWTGEWSRRDPAEPHWHFGPVAVDASLQGRGIGSTMLSDFCSRMDARTAISYLETDKSVNVRFYEKFGFKVVSEAEVLGLPNWFMSREPSL